MTQIPFFLVTGFLGSGKTTFLKRIVNSYAKEKKIGLIQNEFAPANVDGETLRKEGGTFEMLEINNGSVFCVCLLNDFITSLYEFVNHYKPDMVFLEASGLSDPIAIAQLLDANKLKNDLYLARVWTIADAANFLKQHAYLTQVQHQIRIADVVILNKTDLADKEQVSKSTQAIQSLNPFAKIIRTTYCHLPEDELINMDPVKPIATRTKAQHAEYESCGRPKIGVGVLRSSRSIDRETLIKFIDIYTKNTIRIKGIAKLDGGKGLAVQTSYRHVEYKDVDDYHGSTELIAMGERFNLAEFSKTYRTFVK